jgi:hypothetical protein
MQDTLMKYREERKEGGKRQRNKVRKKGSGKHGKYECVGLPIRV